MRVSNDVNPDDVSSVRILVIKNKSLIDDFSVVQHLGGGQVRPQEYFCANFYLA